VTLGFWPQLAWATEAILETSGAFLAYRRKLKYLCAFLAFSALADMAAFVALRFGWSPYVAVEWTTEAIQYLMLSVLACKLVAQMLQDYRRIGPYAGKVVMLVGLASGWIFYRGETLQDRFLDTEIFASSLLIALIILGLLTRKRALEWPLLGQIAGLMIWLLGTGACGAAQKYWPMAVKLYPIGEILGLLCWNLAAYWNQWETKAIRIESGRKFEPTGVYREFEQKRVM